MPGQQSIQRIMSEMAEWSFRGPFGGIQTEMPLDTLEDVVGLSYVDNFLFLQGKAWTAPAFKAGFASTDTNTILAIFDFFNATGVLKQGILTTRNLYLWNNATGAIGAAVPGAPALTGAATDQYTWTTVNGLLCFCQGVDPVQSWNGAAANFAPVSGAAVPAKYLEEVETHLLAAFTHEGGNDIPQRVRWTGAGDPTDWVSFSSGVTDVLNNLGPITGLKKVKQYGCLLQYNGLTQVIPTGVGTAPFDFVPYGNAGIGCTIPGSVASFGDDGVVFANWGDIWFFDGSNYESLSSKPMSDGRRRGAKSFIYWDLLAFLNSSSSATVSATAIYDLGGLKYKAYVLSIGPLIWIYSFDEDSWTRLATVNTITNVTAVGRFFNNNVGGGAVSAPTFFDLVGDPYSDTVLSTYTFNVSSPFQPPPGLVLAGAAGGGGNDVFFQDFTKTQAENGAVGAHLVGPVTNFGDRQNTKTVCAARFVVECLGDTPVTFNFFVYNEKGQSVTSAVSITDTGNKQHTLVKVVPLQKLNGWGFNFRLTWTAGRFAVREVALQYVIGGPYKNA